MGVRVILADDHSIVRNGLCRLLQQHDGVEIVAEAKNGHDTLDVARRLIPDVVIMDISMPDLNGIEATRQLTKELPETKVIALSMHSSRKFVIEMLKAGAAGYLLKDCAVEELTTAIDTVVAHKTYLSPAVADVVVENYVRNVPDGEQSAYSLLTQREREVLQLMAEGKTTKQIAKNLYISPKTVEAHRLRLMKKLDMDSVAKLTKYAVQEGLTLPEP